MSALSTFDPDFDDEEQDGPEEHDDDDAAEQEFEDHEQPVKKSASQQVRGNTFVSFFTFVSPTAGDSLNGALSAYGAERVKELHTKYLNMCTTNSNGCRISHLQARSGKSTVKYVRANIYIEEKRAKYEKRKSQNKTVLLHHLVWYAKTGQTSWTGDISHLCGNTKCMNQDHLVCEDHLTNMSRIYCQWVKKVPNHVHNCAHQPKCK